MFQCPVGRIGAKGEVNPRGLAGADPRWHNDNFRLDEPLFVAMDLAIRIRFDRGWRLGNDLADGACKLGAVGFHERGTGVSPRPEISALACATQS